MFEEFITKRMRPKDQRDKIQALFFEEKLNVKYAKKKLLRGNKILEQNFLLPSRGYDYIEPKEVIDLWFETLIYEVDAYRYRSLCWIVGHNVLVNKESGDIISFTGFTGPSLLVDRNNNLGIALLTNRVHPTRKVNTIVKERPNITETIYQELENIKKLHK